jgi:predicted house-cleaning noncanonical NTP pyrophosphatase (MazG superfamily)
MSSCNKLVRDKIPEIIKADGKECETRVLDDQEYLLSLNKKLDEELREYYESESIDELVDMVEVIYAVARQYGISIQEFERLRLLKRQERGGFDQKLLLMRIS